MENEFRALKPEEMKAEMRSLALTFKELYLNLQVFFLKQLKKVKTKEEREEIKGYLKEVGENYLKAKNNVRK